MKYAVKILAPEYPTFEINPYMTIGPGVELQHPFATVLNAKSIGRNFSVKNNVTIGQNRGGRKYLIMCKLMLIV